MALRNFTYIWAFIFVRLLIGDLMLLDLLSPPTRLLESHSLKIGIRKSGIRKIQTVDERAAFSSELRVYINGFRLDSVAFNPRSSLYLWENRDTLQYPTISAGFMYWYKPAGHLLFTGTECHLWEDLVSVFNVGIREIEAKYQSRLMSKMRKIHLNTGVFPKK